MWQIILPWLRENLKASGCIQPFAGGCSSIVGGVLLPKDKFVEWLKADPLFRGLLEQLDGQGKGTTINGHHPLRHYLYLAASSAYADATPLVVARGQGFGIVGAVSLKGEKGYFYNDYVQGTTSITAEAFKKALGRTMLFHAKVTIEGKPGGDGPFLPSPDHGPHLLPSPSVCDRLARRSAASSSGQAWARRCARPSPAR